MFFDVMRNSITLYFFKQEEVPVTKELIQRNVLVICYSLISLLCVYQITKRMFSDDDYNVITGTSFRGMPKRVIRSENKNDTLTEYNRKVSSVHEAGHAVMAYLMEIESFQVILSDIQPRVVMVQKLQDANADKGILIKYAGAIAEEILLDKMHIGKFYR